MVWIALILLDYGVYYDRECFLVLSPTIEDATS